MDNKKNHNHSGANTILGYFLTVTLFIFFTINANGRNFYFSTSAGLDTRTSTQAQNPATPWKTITKLNSFFTSLLPGDSVLFKRGEEFYGSIIVTKSGNSTLPIVIGPYGTGNKPIITGFTNLSSWTNEANGIYSKTVSGQSFPEMVKVNNTQYGMGRWPNSSTWASIDSHSGVTSITDADLNSNSINWAGAQLLVRNSTWNMISKYNITNHTSHTLIFSGGIPEYPIGNGYGYFIQNDLRTLDVFGEWYYNTSTSKLYMYFGSENPNNYSVQIATIDKLCHIENSSYITLTDMAFKGANHDAIYGRINDRCIYQNCDIDFSGNYGIEGSRSYNLKAIGNSINHSNDCAFLIGTYSDGVLLSGNMINNTGLVPGVGQCIWFTGKAIVGIQGNNLLVEYNEVYNSGSTGILASGIGTVVKNNYLNNFGMYKADCAGIQVGNFDLNQNMIVKNNIVLNGIGAPEGLPVGQAPFGVAGLYVDYYRNGGVEFSNNTVGHCVWTGIIINGAQNVSIINNTVFDCDHGIDLQEIPGLGNSPRNITMNGNILFAKGVSQIPLYLNSTANNFNLFGTFNYNYYANPLDNAKPILPLVNWNGTKKSLSEWYALSGQDLNSNISPISLTDTANIDFYYNPTQSNKVITLPVPMIDVKGNKYSNSLTLLPYTSVILMLDPNPTQQVAPVYVSSVIENSPGNRIDITYNLPLANIVPAASAFTVKVNSVVKPVSFISVNGIKVNLYIDNSFSYSDIVTVSYSKPSLNPLQSVSGGQAATITDKPVSNNFSSPGNPPPVYVNSAIGLGVSNRIDMIYDINLAGVVPVASAFTVKVNSIVKPVSFISIYGTHVYLYINNSFVYGDVVTVAYTKPATNPLQSLAGGLAATITDKPVTNNFSPPDNPAPIFVSAAVGIGITNKLDMTYDINLAGIVPSASAFSVKVNSVVKSVSFISIYEKHVFLYIDNSFVYGDVVTVAYTKPATNPLQSVLGAQAATITYQSVTNNFSPPGNPAPIFVSAAVGIGVSNKLVMTYDINLAGIVPAASAFTVKVNSIIKPVSFISIYGTQVNLYTSNSFINSDVVTVAYTKPVTNPLQSVLGEQAATITDQTVTNNIPKSALINDSTSINSFINLDNINIYPNPARDYICIDFSETLSEPEMLRIYDLSGRLCFEIQVEKGITNKNIPLNLKSGVYYVKVVSDNFIIFTQKLIVIK